MEDPCCSKDLARLYTRSFLDENDYSELDSHPNSEGEQSSEDEVLDPMKNKTDSVWKKAGFLTKGNGCRVLKDIDEHICCKTSDKEYAFLCAMQHNMIESVCPANANAIYMFATCVAAHLNKIMSGKSFVLTRDRIWASINRRRLNRVRIDVLVQIKYRFIMEMNEQNKCAEEVERKSLRLSNVLPEHLIQVAVDVMQKLESNPDRGHCIVVVKRKVVAKTKQNDGTVEIKKKLLLTCESMLLEVVSLTCTQDEMVNHETVFDKLSDFFCGFQQKHVKKVCSKLRKSLEAGRESSALVHRSLATFLLDGMQGLEDLNDSVEIHLSPDNPEWTAFKRESGYEDDPQVLMFNNHETKHMYLTRMLQYKETNHSKRLPTNPNMLEYAREMKKLKKIPVGEYYEKLKLLTLDSHDGMETPSSIQMKILDDERRAFRTAVNETTPSTHISPEKSSEEQEKEVNWINQVVYVNWKLVENILTDNTTSNTRVLLNYVMGGGHLQEETTPFHFKIHESLMFKKAVFQDLVAGDNADVFVRDVQAFDNKINDLLWSLRTCILNRDWNSLERVLEEKPHCLVSFKGLLDSMMMNRERVEKAEQYFRYGGCQKLRTIWRSLWWAKLEATLNLNGLNRRVFDTMIEYLKQLMCIAHPSEFNGTIPAIQDWYTSLVYLAFCLPRDDAVYSLESLNEIRREYCSRLQEDTCAPLVNFMQWLWGLNNYTDQVVGGLVKKAFDLTDGKGWMYLVCAAQVLYSEKKVDSLKLILLNYVEVVAPADFIKLHDLMNKLGFNDEAHQLLMSIANHDVDASDPIVVDYCVELLASCDDSMQQEIRRATLLDVISRLLAFLDFASNKQNETAWKLLENSLQAIYSLGELEIEYKNQLIFLWDERRDWWVTFHSRTMDQEEKHLKKSKKKIFKLLLKIDSLGQNLVEENMECTENNDTRNDTPIRPHRSLMLDIL